MERHVRISRFLVLLCTASVSMATLAPLHGAIEIAEELLVDLDAGDPTAGADTWVNHGTLADFLKLGDPQATTIMGAPAVQFNGGIPDAYQCLEIAPDGLIGLDPTRSVEVWTYNEEIPDEETLLSWGRRGGPCGTNMSFNYGTNIYFGAVGHWCHLPIGPESQDIGWGTVPVANKWHHLVYTYDGTTTRVYADGVETNSEELGAGSIDTHAGTAIVLAAQYNDDGVTLDITLAGILAIGRVRIHDGVLTPAQIQNNFEIERAVFPAEAVPPAFGNVPDADSYAAADPEYHYVLNVTGFPVPTLEVIQPAGGAVTTRGVFTYVVPQPPPASFSVTVRASNEGGTEDATWTVNRRDLPAAGAIATAGELFVDLDAAGETAGSETWENNGTLADFQVLGLPVSTEVGGAPAVLFNGVTPDAYQCLEVAPLGLIGLNPTRTIEVWAFNESIADEETLLAWGQRGGPAGTNMSFNYGLNAGFGAVGHWDQPPDLGWGAVPEANAWHHLAYTFDGLSTRVYADGLLANAEDLGPGLIDTAGGTPITLAAQIEAGGGLDIPLAGILALGKVRVHDGVLSPEEIVHNFNAERDTYGIADEAPVFLDTPDADEYVGSDAAYSRSFRVLGVPPPSVSVLSPAGATVARRFGTTFALEYTFPVPQPASFTVQLEASNTAGSAQASWDVARRGLPPDGQLAVAGELFVDLDAEDGSAGDDPWVNNGTLGDFIRLGAPVAEEIDGQPAVTFNGAGDAYQCVDVAPAGLVGVDPTRTIEVWVYNPEIADEETIVAWALRGGPDGTNMSFNYGLNAAFGAVGHWGAGPDIGWYDVRGAPVALQWHHLVYTYEGTTTRVYADGELVNEEVLGLGVINTHAGTPICLAAQYEADGVTLNTGLMGTLSLARVRVHDGTLSAEEVLHNYKQELLPFIAAPAFVDAPSEDFYYPGDTQYTRALTITGLPAPTVDVLEPAGATITDTGVVTCEIPDPQPASFDVEVRAVNDSGTATANWTVMSVTAEEAATGPVHRYSFEADASDSVGGADGTVYGDVTFSAGQAVLNNDGSQISNTVDPFPDDLDPEKLPPGAYIDLPNGIISALGSQATFEAWVTWNGPTTAAWQRIFDFGTSDTGENMSGSGAASPYMFLTPLSGATTFRFGYNGSGPPPVERTINDVPLVVGEEYHVAVTWDDDSTTATLYVNGVRVDEDTATHFLLLDLIDDNNWLGRSQWPDAMFGGSYNEFRIYDTALTPPEVFWNFTVGGAQLPPGGGDGEIFRRGDANRDGSVNIADAVYILQNLFAQGPEILCKDAGDSNDDESVNIADAVYILQNLFAQGPEIPAPGPDACGPDPTPHPTGGEDLPFCDYCPEACQTPPTPCP